MPVAERNPVGVLLLNLGGPDSLGAVEPFLYNLFSDREIIRLGPAFMQKPLARLISVLRHKKTEDAYKLIGGKSPILDITMAQAKALETRLNEERTTGSPKGPGAAGKFEYRVFVGMRYWRPLIEEVVPEMHRQGIRRVIVLTMYPHYSIATTGSSLSRLAEVVSRLPFETFTVSSWYDHPLYIDSLVEKIRQGIDSFYSLPAPTTAARGGSERMGDLRVLFSAHSLPVRFIEEGDPYLDHIRGTIREITKKIDIRWDLSFQSKSGPVKWLEPSTEAMLHSLAQEGVRSLLVVPISFVSDHIETLYEIDILYRDMAASFGIRLERVESLNTSPLFISCLRELVSGAMRETGWGIRDGKDVL